MITFFNKANLLHRMHKHNESLETYNDLVKLEPTNAMVFYHRCLCLRELNRTSEAYESYSEALRLDPTLANV